MPTDYSQLLTKEIHAEVKKIRRALKSRKRVAAKRLLAEIDPTFEYGEDIRYNVYVIELADEVRDDGSFRKENPDASPGLPCLYVGMTAKTPEERFAKHKAGEQHSRIVKKFGFRLRPEFYERLNPMTYNDAEREERALARLLKREGYGVWQN